MSRNGWIGFVVVVVLVLGGLALLSNRDNVDVSKVNAAAIEKEGIYADHVYGNKDAKVVLIEYGDFQCPGCGAAFPIVKEVKEKYKDNLAFAFRNFPLTNIHPNALAAATAAEAADQQGKFFEMHDQLFINQKEWESADASKRNSFFEKYAGEIGLKLDQFKNDYANNEDLGKKIEWDRAVARKINASSTPTFIINGRKLEQNEWQTKEAFEKTVTDELKKAGVKLPTTQ